MKVQAGATYQTARATLMNKQKQANCPKSPTNAHHWLIETPQGATSQGCCRLCGEERSFANVSTGGYWDDLRKDRPQMTQKVTDGTFTWG